MSSATTPKTIVLSGGGIQLEAPAAAAITPGHLLQRTSAGKVAVHASVTAMAASLWAIENDLIGDGISDAYAADDQVRFQSLQPGSTVYALLKAGEDAAVADYLTSGGDGSLAVFDAAVGGVIVAQALEAVDNDPGTGGAAVRIRVAVVPPVHFLAAA